MKHLKLLAAAGIICMGILLVFGLGESWAKSAVNKNWRGLALKGYDPVAYFTLGKPVKGKKAFQFKWQGANWRFSSQDHLDQFKSEPEKYAPQYGGY
jgi:YHS domain-containing protein